MSNYSNTVNRDFFGQEVPAAFTEMVRKTYIFEGKDPNKIHSVYEEAKKDLQLTSWQEGYLLERVVTMHRIREELPLAEARVKELVRQSFNTPVVEIALILALSNCQIQLDLFCESGDREQLNILERALDSCQKYLPNNQTIFDGRHLFYQAALHIYRGEWLEAESCLGSATDIFQALSVSYLEASCHLLALKSIYTVDKNNVLNYYEENAALFQEYPIIDKAAKEIQLQTAIWFRDHTIYYLEKEDWKVLIKCIQEYLTDLNKQLAAIKMKIDAPL